ncbi:MAG: hypothetical protein WAL75_18295 [Terracidiphilus sp.]
MELYLSGLRNRRLGATLMVLGLVAFATGCRVHVEKGANGEDKNVQVDTPFGGVHVNTDQTTAADLGLPVYPGAQVVADSDKDKSADIRMGFGEWQMRIKVVNYSTPDSEDKVSAFYKKALTRYGDVIACQDKAAVGEPTKTSEGLTCDDKHGGNIQVNDHGSSYGYHSGTNGFELKAGSERHQHVVGFQSSAPGQTRFALVALDLPAGTDGSGKAD